MTTPDDVAAYEQAARELRDAQRKEYGQYVARDVIYIQGARAFNPGDPVPVSHIESGLVAKEQVVGSSTKAAAAITEKG